MAVVTTNLGTVTAYGDAVAAGYTGTKAQWQALMADYATVGTQAAQDAQTASTAAQTATTKAGEASQSATRAEQAASSITTPDATLTQAGVAADAKKTGDEISELKSGFNDLYNTAYITDSASGAVAHFVDGADDVPMKSVKVNIEPVQSGSGDPSPSNVRPISGRDSVKVTRAGKNLAKEASVYNLNNYIISPVFLHKGTYTVSVQRQVSDKTSIYVRRSKTVDLSRTAFFTKFNVISASFTVEEADYYFVQIYRGTGTETWEDYPITNAMLEVGSSATEFEPYNGNTYDVSLASAGTVYGGTLDAVSGELVVDRKGVPMETLTWGRTTSYANPIFYSNVSGKAASYEKTLCSIFHNLDTPNVISAQGFATRANDGDYACSNGNAQIYARLDSATTVHGFVTSVTGQTIVYPLATPLTYQLSATEIKSLLGINNVWSDAGDTACEYRADTKLYIERLTEPDADMIADSNIVSGQYFMAGNSLYKATANIASGASVIVGTNAIRKSLSEALNEINS